MGTLAALEHWDFCREGSPTWPLGKALRAVETSLHSVLSVSQCCARCLDFTLLVRVEGRASHISQTHGKVAPRIEGPEFEETLPYTY